MPPGSAAREHPALSVVAPNGDKIRTGQKKLEIRSWSPDSLPIRDLVIVQNKRSLKAELDEDPNGIVVALVDVVGVQPWREDQLEAACAQTWTPGLLAWSLENIRAADCEHPVVAARGLYKVSASVKIEA